MSNKLEKYKCGPGQIERVGYHKKGYQRKKYQRKTGTTVPSSYVSSAFVPPVCIKDMGKPGKGPKTLPKLKNIIHLTKYGYGIHKSSNTRHKSLLDASKDFGTLPVLRRLNLIRNYQAIPENKEKFTDDVEFMKKMYSTEKYKKNQYGGSDVFQDPFTSTNTETETETSDSSDVDIDNIELPETRNVEINTIIDTQKTCDSEGKCGVRNIVYEKHNVNGKEIIYYTLGEKDIDDIHKLDLEYFNSDEDRNNVYQKIINNRGLLIGLKVDDILQGYFHYDPMDNMEVQVIWFCANKGYGTPLYIFMEKYFKVNGYTRIILTVSLEGANAMRRLNFWYLMGFITFENLPEEKKIRMEKYI